VSVGDGFEAVRFCCWFLDEEAVTDGWRAWASV
jgi:hypothetical protein